MRGQKFKGETYPRIKMYFSICLSKNPVLNSLKHIINYSFLFFLLEIQGKTESYDQWREWNHQFGKKSETRNKSNILTQRSKPPTQMKRINTIICGLPEQKPKASHYSLGGI